MTVARRLLLNRLEAVAPAVATTDSIPLLMHVCFDGARITAYNDKIALSTPRSTTFRGTIPAAQLMNLLGGSRSAVVDLVADGDQVAAKLGGTTMRLPTLPAEWFAERFTMPAMPKQNLLQGIAGRFLAGIQHCLQSIESNATVPDKMGITLIPDRNQLQLFSTNSITISRAPVALPDGHGFRKRMILSPDFCRELLRLAKRAHTIRLAIMTDHALFGADDTLLYGRLIASDDPIDYTGVFSHHMPDNLAERLVSIPRTFAALLERVTNIVGAVGRESRTEITIRRGTAWFRAASSRGEITDTLALPGHPDIGLWVYLSHVLAACKAFAPTHVLFTESCVVLARGELLHMTAALSGEQG